MKTDVSVVVPTKNEELWLPRLLQSLKYSERVAEVIVADAQSEDRTVEIARKFGCKVVAGGGCAEGRNNGASVAVAPFVAFIEADVVLPLNLIDLAASSLSKDPHLVAVHFQLRPISNEKWITICYLIVDLYVRASKLFGIYRGVAGLLVVRRRHFEKVGGYDQSIEVAEDVDFVQRLGRCGSVMYVREHCTLTSPRRFGTDGGLKFPLKVVFWAVLREIGIKRSVLKYNWKKHEDELFRKEELILNTILPKYALNQLKKQAVND